MRKEQHEGPQGLPLLRAVAERLAEDRLRIVEDVIHELRTSQPEYDPVDDEELDRSVTRNVNMAVRTLARGAALPPEELNEGFLTGRERYKKNIPVEDVLQGFRACFGIIHSYFVRHCEAMGSDTQTALRGSRILWAVADGFTARMVTAYRDLATEAAIRDAELRTEGVRRVLRGESSTGIRHMLELNPSHRYAAVCSTVPRGLGSDVRRRLELSGSRPKLPAQLVFEGDLIVGLIAKQPEPLKGQTVGVGPFVNLSDIPTSYEIARKLLSIAQAKQQTGVYSIKDASWRLALFDNDEVSKHLEEKCITPVLDNKEYGKEIIESVSVYFRKSCVVREAAEELVLHENTLRYRLKRYQDITGLDLSRPADVAEIQWALESRLLEKPQR